jgi:hypothetical protein
MFRDNSQFSMQSGGGGREEKKRRGKWKKKGIEEKRLTSDLENLGVKRFMGETGRKRVNREKGLTDEYEKGQMQGVNKWVGDKGLTGE